MHTSRTLSRHTLRRAALAVALLFTGAGTAAANDATGAEPAATVAYVLPGDRAIAQIESLDPANDGLTFDMLPLADALAIPKAHPEPLNICIPCDNLA